MLNYNPSVGGITVGYRQQLVTVPTSREKGFIKIGLDETVREVVRQQRVPRID